MLLLDCKWNNNNYYYYNTKMLYTIEALWYIWQASFIFWDKTVYDISWSYNIIKDSFACLYGHGQIWYQRHSQQTFLFFLWGRTKNNSILSLAHTENWAKRRLAILLTSVPACTSPAPLNIINYIWERTADNLLLSRSPPKSDGSPPSHGTLIGINKDCGRSPEQCH